MADEVRAITGPCVMGSNGPHCEEMIALHHIHDLSRYCPPCRLKRQITALLDERIQAARDLVAAMRRGEFGMPPILGALAVYEADLSADRHNRGWPR